MLTIRSLALSALAMLVLEAQPAGASSPVNVAYYFPEGRVCTLILDFQPTKDKLERLTGTPRTLSIATSLLSEVKVGGTEKCKTAEVIRMMAVYIPGVDNYGRPDFGSRLNLLRIDSTAAAINTFNDLAFKDIESLKKAVTLVPIDR